MRNEGCVIIKYSSIFWYIGRFLSLALRENSTNSSDVMRKKILLKQIKINITYAKVNGNKT